MKKRSILVMAGITLCLMLLFVYGHYQRKQAEREANRSMQTTKQKWVKESDAEWEKGGFISTGFPDVVGSGVLGETNVAERGVAGDHLKFIKLDANLNSEQIHKLSELVRDFLSTFGNSNITFNDYLKFKTTGRSYRFDFSGIIGGIIKGNHLVIPDNATEQERAALVWGLLTPDPAVSGGGSPAITAVDPRSVKLWVYKGSDTNYAAGGISLRVINNFARGAINALIEYDDNPGEVLKRSGVFTYVAVSMICHYNTSPNPGPIIIGLYWSDQEKNWMPWEFVSDNSTHYHILF